VKCPIGTSITKCSKKRVLLEQGFRNVINELAGSCSNVPMFQQKKRREGWQSRSSLPKGAKHVEAKKVSKGNCSKITGTLEHWNKLNK
jgi:hypothetical protein